MNQVFRHLPKIHRWLLQLPCSNSHSSATPLISSRPFSTKPSLPVIVKWPDSLSISCWSCSILDVKLDTKMDMKIKVKQAFTKGFMDFSSWYCWTRILQKWRFTWKPPTNLTKGISCRLVQDCFHQRNVYTSSVLLNVQCIKEHRGRAQAAITRDLKVEIVHCCMESSSQVAQSGKVRYLIQT